MDHEGKEAPVRPVNGMGDDTVSMDKKENKTGKNKDDEERNWKRK